MESARNVLQNIGILLQHHIVLNTEDLDVKVRFTKACHHRPYPELIQCSSYLQSLEQHCIKTGTIELMWLNNLEIKT